MYHLKNPLVFLIRVERLESRECTTSQKALLPDIYVAYLEVACTGLPEILLATCLASPHFGMGRDKHQDVIDSQKKTKAGGHHVEEDDMDDPAAQLHQNLQDAVSNALAMRRPILHHLSADTAWLLMIPRPRAATRRGGRVYFNILIDPWLSGTQTDYISWLSKQWHADEPRVPSIAAVEDLIRETESLASGLRSEKGKKSNGQDNEDLDEVETLIDAVAISHQFTDHCHEQTMRDVHPDVPVFATEVSRLKCQARWLTLMTATESNSTDRVVEALPRRTDDTILLSGS